MQIHDLKQFLDSKASQYNQPSFIARDPVSIPHRFSSKKDIEVMGFFAAILAWGQRNTIINKCIELADRMDNAPFTFISGHEEIDLKALLGFKHRTFNDTDLLYFIRFLKTHYQNFSSLEDAFLPSASGGIYRTEFIERAAEVPVTMKNASAICYQSDLVERCFSVEDMLNHFRAYFFSLPDYPPRTRKHISSPLQGSTCKRLNMFLRWMVRKDGRGVDFGLWKRIDPAVLICPCDLHVIRVARRLGLIKRKQTDWKTALELTEQLLAFDPADPVKYDFALFGLGIDEKF